MKTIKEWLEELPEPYKTQALTNMKNFALYAGEYEVTSLDKAIEWAFYWGQTPEGLSYWDDLHQASLKIQSQ